MLTLDFMATSPGLFTMWFCHSTFPVCTGVWNVYRSELRVKGIFGLECLGYRV